MPVFDSNLNYKIIKKILKEKYNLNVTKIKKIKNGSANLYNVYSSNKHYVLKEYQDKFNEESIVREYKIFECLKKQGLNVPEYLKCVDGKICIKYNGRFISLQKYIDGNILGFYKATKKQLKDCAQLYADILKKMANFRDLLPEYSLDLLNNKKIESVKENYLHLIEKTNDKKIIKELTEKLTMLSELSQMKMSDLDKITIANSHGDYNVSQFIYDDVGNVKVVLDYITAKKMPVVLELFRSFIYMDPKSKNGSIDINNLTEYIKHFNNYYKLNYYDVKYMIYIYYIEMVMSIFGYQQYIADNTKRNYLKIGRRIYKQCKYLRKNEQNITNALLENIDFEENDEINFYHLIDHKGFGTIHKLLIPLCQKYNNHHIFTPYKGDYYLSEEELKKINKEKNNVLIIHSTGSKDSVFLNNYNSLFPNKKIFIFLHTSAEYQKIKKRSDFINFLIDICNKDHLMVLVPSKEVASQYSKYGIKTIPIQLGISDIEDIELYKKEIPKLKKYYNKIITTCSSDKEIYKFVKGIDIYQDIIIKNKLEKYALIAGSDNNDNVIFNCKKFAEEDFLNILYHSKIYIQFSRYETYNITAIQAKRFKIPVLLMNSEGTYSCMNGYVFDKVENLEKEMLNIILSGNDNKILEKLYLDSKERESLSSFKDSLEAIVKYE